MRSATSSKRRGRASQGRCDEGSIFGLLDIARSGMNAQSAALSTTGQNVSNATTPGYVRRTTVMQTDGNGGATASTIARSADSFSFGRLVDEGGKKGAADARSGALATVEGILAPGSGSISDQMNALFDAFNHLSAYPMDIPTRQAALSKASDLAQTISTTASSLASAKDGLLTKAQGVASEVNDRLARIAALNDQIAQDPGAADLRDQRDTLVHDVGDRIGARAVEDASGRVTLFAAGTALVDGGNAASIAVSTDSAGAMKVQVKRAGGAVDITQSVNDGSLGGLREARDVDLASASQKLDQLAYDFGSAINNVHTAGFGLDGASGRPLFTQAATVSGAARAFCVDASMQGHPERLAAAANASDVPGGNDVALALGQLGTASLAGGSPPASRFGEIASAVGSAKSSSDAEAALRSDTLAQAQTLHDSVTGVSIDEEMANMTRFQRAYEASTKVLRTVDDLLSGLMQELG